MRDERFEEGVRLASDEVFHLLSHAPTLLPHHYAHLLPHFAASRHRAASLTHDLFVFSSVISRAQNQFPEAGVGAEGEMTVGFEDGPRDRCDGVMEVVGLQAGGDLVDEGHVQGGELEGGDRYRHKLTPTHAIKQHVDHGVVECVVGELTTVGGSVGGPGFGYAASSGEEEPVPRSLLPALHRLIMLLIGIRGERG